MGADFDLAGDAEVDVDDDVGDVVVVATEIDCRVGLVELSTGFDLRSACTAE